MNKEYDYLIVGAGLFGACIAYRARQAGKKVLVIDKRPHLAGNCYSTNIDGIEVHRYGAHIFHTSNREVWDFVNQFASFNRYTNSPIARIDNEIYNLPFNMNTFAKLWPDVFTPEDAQRRIAKERSEMKDRTPNNLEEQAISLVGRTIYEKLIKGYTEKQWGRDCKDLPADIIKRLPVRFIYDNNYFNDDYQGIPIEGYTKMIENMLNGIEVRLDTNFFEHEELKNIANTIIYTGPIDEYFHYQLGTLEYRSLDFETKTLDTPNFQGNAVVNYTSRNVPYTRIIEHKHFSMRPPEEINKTIITYEYPADWTPGKEAYYTVNDERNNTLAEKYRELAKNEQNVIFGGRLAEYRYYDMDDCLASALSIELP